MKSITPSSVRLLVLSQQGIHGCLALRLMTGMPISALKWNLQRQRFCGKPYLCLFLCFASRTAAKRPLPGLRSPMRLTQTLTDSAPKWSRAHCAETWWKATSSSSAWQTQSALRAKQRSQCPRCFRLRPPEVARSWHHGKNVLNEVVLKLLSWESFLISPFQTLPMMTTAPLIFWKFAVRFCSWL